MCDIDISFVKVVQEMREAQKEYFASRSSEALRKSKELERRVDRLVSELLAPARQCRLL